jgi:hypothetical protein
VTAPDGWDLGEEVEARTAMASAVAANDELLRAIPYPQYRAKGCADGAHDAVAQHAAGVITWTCRDCAKERVMADGLGWR